MRKTDHMNEEELRQEVGFLTGIIDCLKQNNYRLDAENQKLKNLPEPITDAELASKIDELDGKLAAIRRIATGYDY